MLYITNNNQIVEVGIKKCKVQTKKIENGFDVRVDFTTNHNENGTILWINSKEQQLTKFELENENVVSVSIKGCYHTPQIDVTNNPNITKRLLDIQLIFNAGMVSAMKDQNLIDFFKDQTPTARISNCDGACGVAGAAVGGGSGAAIGGACTGDTIGVAAPGCVIAAGTLGGAIGGATAWGCSALFC